MSSLSRLLRCTFSTSIQPPSAAATTTPAIPPFIKSVLRDFDKERDLKRLVDKFKKSCEDFRFRTKVRTYESTIRRLAAAKRFQWIEEVLEDQKKYKDITKEGFNARLISLYGKSGMFDNAKKVFDQMPERSCGRTVLSFNALLAACVNSRKYDDVEELFRGLPEKVGIEPDVVSYNTVISAFCDMGSLDSGVSLLDEMEKKGLEPDFITFNTLLNGFYVNGRLVDGERIWGQMVAKNISPDIRSYNAKLRGLALGKRTSDAVELMEEMRNRKIKPDVFSFSSLIRGFIIEDKLEEAKHWYGEMWKNDCKPDAFTFTLLIPFVCEKGDLDFAFKLSKDVFKRKRFVDDSLLQQVVDELVKFSKNQEANELIQLGKSGSFNLKLPSSQ